MIIFLFCTSCSLMSENKSFEENYLIQPKFETEEHLPQYDADYRFAHSGSTVCETEDAYYGTLFDDPYYLRYYDKKSQYSGILCGKPECTHTDENCDGYIMGEVGGVRLYDNQLYWIQNMYGEGYALWCMDLNGKQRQRVQNIDAAIFSKLNTNIIMQVHRGYVYISGMGCTVWNGQSITKVMVIVYPIGKDEVVTVYDQTYTNGSADLYTQLKGNKLYKR